MTSRLRDARSLKDLETLYHTGAVGNLSDGQLLDWFLAARGAGEAAEAGFTAIVNRHGPMVLRVCRQILGDSHDAQDAFQATFLILVRKAGSVRKRDSVASWLHGIARRVAQRARADRVRRRDYERRSAEMATRTEVRCADESESWPEIHEEVARLPAKYRESVVLCYLEGLTTEEAARRLGCPQGTVLSRLSRARERLRDRLTHRGLAAPAGLMAGGLSLDALPAALSRSVVQSALQLAAGGAGTITVPASVAGLAQGVLRTMIVTKLKTTAAALTAIAALAAGAGAIVLQAPAVRSQAARTREESRPSPSELAANIDKARALLAPGLVPENLKWTDVGPDERLRVLDFIAGQIKADFALIRTWKGTYTFQQRQLLTGRSVPPTSIQNLGPVIQEFDGRMGFAIDMAADKTFRDNRYSAMTFYKAGTKEVVDFPNVGVSDTRSLVTKDEYIYFQPDERATYGYLRHIPEAHNKRMARRADPRRRSGHFGDMMDPRAFFTFDTGNKTWLNLELITSALRGMSGDTVRRRVEEGFSLAQADSPDGRWYRHQQFYTASGPSFWVTAFWSPRAGYNPVGYLTWSDKPDGKISTKVEWEWTVVDGIHVPSTIKEVGYEVPGGLPSRERESTLSDCVLNQPLDPHQFDHAGLGMADGDLIIDEVKRVGYIIKAGEPVKLGDFVNFK